MKKRILVFFLLTAILAVSIAAVPAAAYESSSIPSDKYVFIDTHVRKNGVGNVGPQMTIDFPTYSFNEERGTLTSYLSLDVNEETKVILGSGQSLTGTAGTGVATRLTPCSDFSVEDKFSVDADGTVHYNYNGTIITLKPGEEWTDTTESAPSFEGADGKIINTFTIANYGILDKANIQHPGNPTPVPSPTPSVLLGDLNRDGQVNSTDYALLKRYILMILPLPIPDEADLNGDGQINSIDYALMKRRIIGI